LLSEVYDTVMFEPVTNGDIPTVTVTFWPTVKLAGEVERVSVAFALFTKRFWGVEKVSA